VPPEPDAAIEIAHLLNCTYPSRSRTPSAPPGRPPPSISRSSATPDWSRSAWTATSVCTGSTPGGWPRSAGRWSVSGGPAGPAVGSRRRRPRPGRRQLVTGPPAADADGVVTCQQLVPAPPDEVRDHPGRAGRLHLGMGERRHPGPTRLLHGRHRPGRAARRHPGPPGPQRPGSGGAPAARRGLVTVPAPPGRGRGRPRPRRGPGPQRAAALPAGLSGKESPWPSTSPPPAPSTARGHRDAGNGTTEVAVRVEGDAGRFYALVGPLLGLAVRRSIARDLRTLKQTLEPRSRLLDR
jgi:hypothetical protein